jgi:hypothetical protein
VITQDNRYFNEIKEYRFSDVQVYPAWTSIKKLSTSLVSFDHGETYFRETNRHILLGVYFFIGDIMHEDTRTVFDWFGLLSEFGGMQGIIIIIFEFFIFSNNDVQMVTKSVRSIFFRRGPKGPELLRFRFLHTLPEYPFACFCPKKSKGARLFDTGQDRIKNELDVLRIVQTLQKVKASIKVLVDKGRDPEVVDAIKAQYHEMVYLFTSGEEEETTEDKMLEFLERDEKRALVLENDIQGNLENHIEQNQALTLDHMTQICPISEIKQQENSMVMVKTNKLDEIDG